MTYSVGGPVLKDRLWFYVAYFDKKHANTEYIDADALQAGQAYTFSYDENRTQLKLTWLVNQDHTLVGSWNSSEKKDLNRDYSAGELAALVPQNQKFGFWNLGTALNLGPLGHFGIPFWCQAPEIRWRGHCPQWQPDLR